VDTLVVIGGSLTNKREPLPNVWIFNGQNVALWTDAGSVHPDLPG